MVAISGAFSQENTSVYRKLGGHLGGHSANKVTKIDDTSAPDFRNSGQKKYAERVARQKKAQELYEQRTERFIPSNLAIEHALRSKMANPSNQNNTMKAISAFRDLVSGIHAGPLPAHAVADQQDRHSTVLNRYM